ncbi:MAG: hypothetical protein LUC45_01295 [Paraprevotella sp.]|nr:hypothetical protein [Paraprevotella sp.]
MMRSLHIISLLFFFLWTASAVAQEFRQYVIDIDFPHGKHVSGICIIRMDGTERTMSVVNEFGIKAYDAIYSSVDGKVRLYNVIGFLNKRYIHRVITKDMAVLFSFGSKTLKGRTFLSGDDCSIVLNNIRLKIIYHLKPIEHAVE